MLEEFYRRRQRGSGRFFTREEIDKAGSLIAIFSTVPGVRARTAMFGGLGLQFARCKGGIQGGRVMYFTDGVPSMAGMELPPEDIAAIEVYRGVTELPPEAVGNACAAVFIWTRRS